MGKKKKNGWISFALLVYGFGSKVWGGLIS